MNGARIWLSAFWRTLKRRMNQRDTAVLGALSATLGAVAVWSWIALAFWIYAMLLFAASYSGADLEETSE